MSRVEETTITIREESNQSCQVSVSPSRSMSKKVKKIQLQFIMRDPQVWAHSFVPLYGKQLTAGAFPRAQRLVDAVKANIEGSSESDVCTDPILISFFETHPEYNKLSYTQARLERYLGKAVKLDVSKKDERGVVRTVKETMWWAKHVVTINESTISW